MAEPGSMQVSVTHCLPDVPRDVLVDAMADFMRDLQTAPMTLTEVAAAFNCHRSRAREIIATIPGAEPCGNSWRLPLRAMPVPYLREIKFL